MYPAVEQQFEGLEEEIEQSITDALEGSVDEKYVPKPIQQTAIKQSVLETIEEQLQGDAGAAKAVVAKRRGGGGSDHGFVTSEDRAAAFKRAGGDDETIADNDLTGLSKRERKIRGVRRRVEVLLGKVAPENSDERYIASLEGKRKERAVGMLEKEVEAMTEDGLDKKAAAIKTAGDEAAEDRRENWDEYLEAQRESIATPDWE